jgi:TolB protein
MKLPTLLAVLVLAALPATASADVFNGRIAFSSFRVDPPAGQPRTGDIFTMNPDGSDVRRLTENPADDAQSDWAPGGLDIAYRIRRAGGMASTRNFEVSRMTAAGEGHRQLTFTPEGLASSQPSWFPDGSGLLFRRSGGNEPGQPIVGAVWKMGPLGESPEAAYDPAGAQWYPTFSPDGGRVLFTTTLSPSGDRDRAIQTVNADGSGLTTLFDAPGAFDSGPAWSPDGTRIAFESNADVGGGNPEGDEEIWIMGADGANPTQLTRNASRDEGAAWSPDGKLLAYSSGPDNEHVDINVMTAGGVHLRRITDYEGRDESPDWQAIPAPDTDRRCGDAGSARDVRASGLRCAKALALAARWSPSETAGFDQEVKDFGGTLRVVLTHRRKLVAFLYQAS